MQNQEELTVIQTEVLSRLDAVAAKMNIATEQLWEIFIRQTVINGATEAIVWLGILPISLFVFVVLFRQRVKDPKKNRWATDGYDGFPTFKGVFGICSAIMVVVSGFTVAASMNVWIAKIFNPEYYAWLEIRRILQ